MLNKRHIVIVIGLFAIVMAAVLMVGCGDDEKTKSTAASAPQCDPNQKSIIPAPSGKVQHVYFFRDT